MIELLMVIMIIAILGATALPQFLDFRNEAKAAVVRQTLQAWRGGVKNQIQQSRLRCGVGNTDTWQTSAGTRFSTALVINLEMNDITYGEGNPAYEICSDAQITNPADRRFFDSSGMRTARTWTLGVPNSSASLIPENPFLANGPPRTATTFALPMIRLNAASLAIPGGLCAWLDIRAQPGIDSFYHWVLVEETGEVYAGTNTLGVRECEF